MILILYNKSFLITSTFPNVLAHFPSPPHCLLLSLVDWWDSSTETPLAVSLASFLNQISHHCQNHQVYDHQMWLCLFLSLQNPVGPEYFLPLCLPLPFPLVVVGSLLANIKVNGLSNTLCPSVVSLPWLSSGRSRDQSCSYSGKMQWISICSSSWLCSF